MPRSKKKDDVQHIDWSELRIYWRERKARWELEMQDITKDALPNFTGESFNAGVGKQVY
jgi:hypothetical protein